MSSVSPIRNPNRNRNPNWLELPEEIWIAILSKLETIDIFENTQKVCPLFRKLCKLPSMFTKINMCFHDDVRGQRKINNFELANRLAVDRSSGQLLDISLDDNCDRDTLMYIAERSPNLKHLRLIRYPYGFGMVEEAVQKLPMLEEVQLILCDFTVDNIEAVGHNLPFLRSFKLFFSSINSTANGVALSIAKSMPQLRHLQLIGNYLTDEGLRAILDGCPLLESLDLRKCFYLKLSGDLGERCKAMKNLLLPHDSSDDYGHPVFEEGYGEFGYEYILVVPKEVEDRDGDEDVDGDGDGDEDVDGDGDGDGE